MMIANNLPSGYFRDFADLSKKFFLPAFQELKDCFADDNLYHE